MTEALLTMENLSEKIGKKSFLTDDYTLAAKLNYESGIPEFDSFLDGRTLKEINAVIHITKFPKGFAIKIAQLFKAYTYGLPYSDIKGTILTKSKQSSFLTFETKDAKIIFSLCTENINEVKDFLDSIELKYDLEKQKPEAVKSKGISTNINQTKYGVPALISLFIPGLGQIIKGQFLKGIMIWIVGGALISIFSFTVILIPFALGIWAWNIYDAYNANPEQDDKDEIE